MVTVDYLLICDYAFRDETGRASVIGIFEVLFVQAFPATIPHMAIALQLRGQPHDAFRVTITLARPNGDVITTVPFDVPFSADGISNMATGLTNTVFPEAGRYLVKVTTAGKTLISHALRVQQGTPAPGPPARPTHLH